MSLKLPLCSLNVGESGRVVDIIGGRGAISKLIAMGIVPGKRITVIGKRGGALLVSVNGSKFVLGRGLALKVIVDVEQKN